MTDDEERIQIIKLGIEAEHFLNSDLGRYLIDRAELERDKAINEFKTADTTNSSEMLRIQNSINIPDKAIAWLAEIKQVGYVKHEELRRAEDEGLS